MKVSFRYGGRTSQYTFEGGTKSKKHQTLPGERVPDDYEFVIDLAETHPTAIKRYREFVDKNPELYARVYMDESLTFYDSGDGNPMGEFEMLYLVHLNIMGRPIRLGKDYKQKVVPVHDNDKFTLISFEFDLFRSQYVLDKNTKEQEDHHIIVCEPPGGGEFVIDVDETRPKVIDVYRKFVAQNKLMYLRSFMTETGVQAQSHLEGNKTAKGRAEQLFYMTRNLRPGMTIGFEEFFARHITISKMVRDSGVQATRRALWGRD